MNLYTNESRNTEMKKKLEAIIEVGRLNAVNVMEKIQKEVPQDRIVKASVLDFEPDENGIFVMLPGERDVIHATPVREQLHRNALGQMMERANVPMEFANRLATQGAWGNTLLAHNLREIFHKQGDQRYMTRSYAGQMRGFLSNKFRRLDSRPIVDGIAKQAQAMGLVAIDGVATDTRVALKVVLPKVFEIPGPQGRNDYVAWGFSWQNSDFGNGAHSLLEFFIRILCANGATGTETLRQVHLGGSLNEDEIWSAKTYQLDTQRSASMVKDALAGYLSPTKLEEKMKMLEAASNEVINIDNNKNMMEYLKKKLGAGKAKEAIAAFSSADVENLPPGGTVWRMSNAISWLAGKETDGDARLSLMAAAGDVIQHGLKKAA